ncbi:MAG: hypothetical protein M9962_05685 [Oligoflexia bacterium]|nr:hypothetical protein [Oligoflexia bacterium]
MKLLVFLGFVFFLPFASAAEPWEVCLDQGDFSFQAGSFLETTKLSKTGCKMRFVVIGAKGQKYEIDLCNPKTQIWIFRGIDSNDFERLYANSGSCRAPMFGADLELSDGDGPKYEAAKASVLKIFASVQKQYQSKEKIDLQNLKSIPHTDSKIKMACASYLVEEYLENCVAFEAAKVQIQDVNPKNLPAGVHPANIK